MKKLLVVSMIITWFISCNENTPKADLVILNGTIYTVNEIKPTVEAVAISRDTICFVGSEVDASKWIGQSTELLDLNGNTMTPGFIEGHGHLMGVGTNLLNLDLMGTKSYDEIVQMVQEKVKDVKPGEWITGRGWHQGKWDIQPENIIGGFPSHHKLSEVSPNNPVFLSHASGHAVLVNAKAMELAGLNKTTKIPEGGEIFRDLSGNPTGVLNETAIGLVGASVPFNSKEQNIQALELGMNQVLKNGITSFHDAGTDSTTIALYKAFANDNKLKIRIYAMLSGSDENLLNSFFQKGPEIGLNQNFLTIRAIKLAADGALGSRGALLLEDYSDAPGVQGLRLSGLDYIKKISNAGYASGFQICIHCIGDRANREILDIYENIYTMDSLKGKGLRYRIEHAQHISAQDIPRFGALGVIPSMQTIHMASDRPWAIDRLGKKRIVEGAYVWNKLTDSGATIVNGTDAPVEPLSPIACFYAAVTRQTLSGTPTGGYEPNQKMSRLEALKSYTINNAYGAFEEDLKGSIEVGKLADFTVFSQDIMKIPDNDILKTEIEYTIVGGKILYQRNEK